MNRELPDVQVGFRRGSGTRDKIANIHWIMEKAREFQKNIYFCFIDYAKAFDSVDHHKLQKILREMGIPDHLTCLFSAAAAKSLQSCPNLCDPIDSSPPDSAVPGILQANLIPACASSSPAFLMMYSPFKLNKQGDNIQP